ncbi:MAG: extradiol dioxygenase [Gammaproteobacteria bacterium]|nr:extradiol dioxygenase [Gammaproteobacteria bacterium]
MINGAHCMIYSTDADADRAFFRDVLELPNVDVGGGWLIFGLPPTELAVHPADANNTHELYLMCNDLDNLMTRLDKANVTCSPISQQSWGRSTGINLPGGGVVGLYQPLHQRPSTP